MRSARSIWMTALMSRSTLPLKIPCRDCCVTDLSSQGLMPRTHESRQYHSKLPTSDSWPSGKRVHSFPLKRVHRFPVKK